MASEFGTTHRQVVQDTNAGNVERKQDKVITSGRRVSGRGTKTIGSGGGKGELARALLDFAEPLVKHQVEESKQKKFAEGYEKGTKEGIEELKAGESVVGTFLFGKSATMRGAQQRILHDTAESRMSERLYSMEEDKAKYDRDQYMAVLKEDLDKELENHDDPETRTKLIDQFTRNSTALARMHTKARQLFVDKTNSKAYMDGIHNASRLYREVTNANDPRGMQEKAAELKAAYAKPEGMSQEAWETHTVTAILSEVGRNNAEAIDVAKEAGIYDKLQGVERQRLDRGLSVYEQRNNASFATEMQTFSDMMNSNPEAAVEYAAGIESKWSNSLNMNKVRATAVEQRRHLDQLARERQERIQAARSFDPSFKKQTREQQAESVSAVINDQARMAIQAERDEAVDISRANGEWQEYRTDAVTDQEVNEWLMRNPQLYENFWASHDVVVPELQKQMRQTLASARALNITADDAEMIRENITQLNVLRSRDEELFYNHMSASQASEYAALSTLFESTNAHPTEAIETYKQVIKDGPYGEPAVDQSRDVANDIYDTFVDMKGEKWLWVFDKTPQNEEVLRSQINDKYAEFYNVTGDAAMASSMARAHIMKNGSVIGNTFQPDAQKIKDVSYNNDYEGYIRGLESNAETKEIFNRANWPADRGLTDPGVTHELLPGGQYVRLTTTGNDGLIKVVTVPVPTSENDMLDYGVKKATGQFLNEVLEPTGRTIIKGAERVKEETENIQLLPNF